MFKRISNFDCAVSRTEISVDSVWPLYGPVAGGTRVTIIGQYLTTVTAVSFGQHQGFIDTSVLFDYLCFIWSPDFFTTKADYRLLILRNVIVWRVTYLFYLFIYLIYQSTA